MFLEEIKMVSFYENGRFYLDVPEYCGFPSKRELMQECKKLSKECFDDVSDFIEYMRFYKYSCIAIELLDNNELEQLYHDLKNRQETY
jgi:hypothetical protein